MALCCALFASGCEATRPLAGDDAPRASAIVNVAPSGDLAIGDTVHVRLTVGQDTDVLSGIVGTLRFDAERLTLLPKLSYPSDMLVASRTTRTLPGQLKLAALRTERGDTGAVTVRLVARRPLTVGTRLVSFDVEERARFGSDGVLYRATPAGERAVPRRMTGAARSPRAMGVFIAAGEYPYGDVTQDSVVSLTDAVQIILWAVSLQPSPAPGSLDEVLGNVFPINSGVGGGQADLDGPGWNGTCDRTVDVTDAVAVIWWAVGQPIPVIGTALPPDWLDSANSTPWRPLRCGRTP